MFREVTMIEFKEVLRLWQEQVPKKRIAARLGLDPKNGASLPLGGGSGRVASSAGDAKRRAGARCAAGSTAGWRSSPRRELGPLQ